MEVGQKDLKAEKYYPATLGGEKRVYHDFDQRITVLQALHAITVNSAFQHKLDGKVGQIKENCFADFVILGQDPFLLEKEGKLTNIATIPVIATIVGNEVVFGFLPETKAGNFLGTVESSYFNDNSVNSGSAIFSIKEQKLNVNDENFIKKQVKDAYFGTVSFMADIAKPNQIGVFTVQIMGNNLPISKLHIENFVSFDKKYPFTLVEQANINQEGLFWLTDRTLETPLLKDTILKAGTAYYINFTVQDNGVFDIMKEDKKIKNTMYIYSEALPQLPKVLE